MYFCNFCALLVCRMDRNSLSFLFWSRYMSNMNLYISTCSFGDKQLSFATFANPWKWVSIDLLKVRICLNCGSSWKYDVLRMFLIASKVSSIICASAWMALTLAFAFAASSGGNFRPKYDSTVSTSEVSTSSPFTTSTAMLPRLGWSRLFPEWRPTRNS